MWPMARKGLIEGREDLLIITKCRSLKHHTWCIIWHIFEDDKCLVSVSIYRLSPEVNLWIIKVLPANAKKSFWQTIQEWVLIEWRIYDSLGPYFHEQFVIMISSKNCNLDSSSINSAISSFLWSLSFLL